MIELKFFKFEEVLNVAHAARHQVVHADNTVTFFDESVTEV
jgi:hypothetical protein